MNKVLLQKDFKKKKLTYNPENLYVNFYNKRIFQFLAGKESEAVYPTLQQFGMYAYKISLILTIKRLN
jgi:hypothetical protein